MLKPFGRPPLPAAFFLSTVAAAARFVSPTPFGSILGVLCVLRLPPQILDRVYAHLADNIGILGSQRYGRCAFELRFVMTV